MPILVFTGQLMPHVLATNSNQFELYYAPIRPIYMSLYIPARGPMNATGRRFGRTIQGYKLMLFSLPIRDVPIYENP